MRPIHPKRVLGFSLFAGVYMFAFLTLLQWNTQTTDMLLALLGILPVVVFGPAFFGVFRDGDEGATGVNP